MLVVALLALSENRDSASRVSLCYGLLVAIYLIGALDEGIHECIGDVAEHGSHEHRQELAGKFVVQTKVDLARILGKCGEAPLSIEQPEGAFDQAYGHELRRLFDVLGREALCCTMVVDLDGGARGLRIAMTDRCSAAPGEKLRIRFYRIDEGKHFRCGVADEH
jgi:hypothetical protein